MIPIIGDLIHEIGGIVSKVVPDADKKNEILLEVEKLGDAANERLHDELMGQIEVNKVEAASGSLFVAGWRPFAGWVGGASLAYAAILYPLLSWGSRICGYTGLLPEVDTTVTLTVLMGMLGLGAQRSYDKMKGTAPSPDYGDSPVPVRKKILGITLPENAPWMR